MAVQFATSPRWALVDVLTARYYRLQYLHGVLDGAPDSVGTRWRRKLVAHALYSTWADLHALQALPA